MIFACHNLKKMANWRWKTSLTKSLIKQIIAKILKFTKKEAYSILNIPLCQQSGRMHDCILFFVNYLEIFTKGFFGNKYYNNIRNNV